MQRKCYESGCTRKVTYACSCTDLKTYSCDDHYLKHTRTPGSHLSECMVVELSQTQRIEALPKFRELISYLQKSQAIIIASGEELIGSITKNIIKALNSIQDLEKSVVELVTGSSIEKEQYEIIKCFHFESSNHLNEKIENIKLNLENLFTFSEDAEEPNWKECNEVIYSRDQSTGGLLSIDLNSYKLSNLDWAPKIGQFCDACKLSKDSYFIHGGFIKSYKGESYIINIKDKNYEQVTDGTCKYHSGSVLQDNTVYIFGGCNGPALDSCETFNLQTKEWRSFQSLPMACHSLTAAILNQEIIVSGYNMNSCYSYNGSDFKSILALSSGYKVVCEGWILVNSVLYENEEGSNSKWKTHNVISWGHYLSIFNVFKKDHFFYFIDDSNSLMRIDTKLKKLETIPFT